MSERFEVRPNEADQAMTRDQLLEAMREADVLCPTVTDRIDGAMLSAVGVRIQLIANYGVGFEHIDTEAARSRGILVSNTPDVLTECTADLALALMLAVARRVVEGDSHVRTGCWSGWRPSHLLGSRVAGKKLGLVGFGRIARAVARRAHFGFGMPVLVYSPRTSAPEPGIPVAFCGSLGELLERAHFVSLHCPSTPETRHLIDATRLQQMRQDAILINTARGVVVDERALLAALESGVIAGAGLDVYEGEPDVSPGLLGRPDVVLLPHLGSATRENRVDMGLRVMQNVTTFLEGGSPPDRVVSIDVRAKRGTAGAARISSGARVDLTHSGLDPFSWTPHRLRRRVHDGKQADEVRARVPAPDRRVVPIRAVDEVALEGVRASGLDDQFVGQAVGT